MAIYNLIKNHTLVDIYRCYELWSLSRQLGKSHVEGDLLEVGVWRGGTGCLLARAVQNGTRSVFLADTFSGVVKATDRDALYKGGEHSDTSLELVQQLITSCDLTRVETLAGVFPDQTGQRIEHRTFALCHVDVDVYESAKGVVEWALSRMPVGGIIVFDDYGFRSTSGVTRLVNEEYAMRPGLLFVHNLNGHALLIKLAA